MESTIQRTDTEPQRATAQRKRESVWAKHSVSIAIVGLVLLGIWHLVSIWQPVFVASPYDSVHQLIQWERSGELWDNVWATTKETLIGSGLALGIGIPIGIILALVEVLDKATRPYIDILNTVPRLGLAPLFVLWFGLGIESKVALVFVSLVLLVIINTHAGIRSVEPDHVLMVQLLGGRRKDIITRVYFPSLVPMLIVTLRLCASFGIASAVIGEFVSGNMGLGYLLNYNTQVLNTVGEFAALLALILLAAVVTIAIMLVERRALRWRRLSGR